MLYRDLETVLAQHEVEVKDSQQRFQQLDTAIEVAVATSANNWVAFTAEQELLKASVQELGRNSLQAAEQLEVRLEERQTADRCQSRAEFEAITESVRAAEVRLDSHQESLAASKAAIADLGRDIGRLEEGWTAFHRETDRRCSEQANNQHSVDAELVSCREQLAARLDGLRMSVSYSGEEMAASQATSLEFGRQMVALQGELARAEENLAVQVEQLDARLTLALSQHERLDASFHTACENSEGVRGQQDATLSAIELEVNSMRSSLADISANVRSKGAAEQSQQDGKIRELDSLLSGQLVIEAKIREVEDTLRGLEDTVSRNYQEHMEQIISLNEEQGKLSGSLTEKWGSLDIAQVTMKNDLKRDIDEKWAGLEQSIVAANVGHNKCFAEQDVAMQNTSRSLADQIIDLKAGLAASRTDIENQLTAQVAAVNESLVCLRRDEVAVAVQTVRSFRTRIQDLERRVTEIDHVMEEYPREWKNSLLFHGLEQKEGESFFTLAAAVSKIIR